MPQKSPVNSAPAISAIADQSVEAGAELQLTVLATDPDANDTLTYSILTDGLPGTPTINQQLGAFSWIPPSAGEFVVTVQASDGELSDTEVFTVTVTEPVEVNEAPLITAIADQSVEAGVELQLTVSATDSNAGDTLSYSILTNGLPGTPTINSQSGSFNWTPPSAGEFVVTVQASDGELTDTEVFTVTVTEPAEVNVAPELQGIADQTLDQGDELRFTVVATDANVNDVLTYTLDSTNLPGNIQLDSGTGLFTWNPPVSDGPGFFVVVRVTDADGLFDTESFVVSVDAASSQNQAPVLDSVPAQDGTTGQQLTFTASATDPDNDVLDFFLDPSAPAGAQINSSTGIFTWTPTNSDLGPVSFPIFVTDGTVSVSTDVFVSVEGGQAGNTPPSFGPQDDLSVAANSTLTQAITATDSDPGDVLTYTLLTENLPGNPTINPDTGVLTWTPPASAANTTFQLEIQATDLAGASDVTSVTVRVLPSNGGGDGGGGQNNAPVVQPIGNQTATVGTPLTFMVDATDEDGDVLDYFLDPTGPFTATLSTQGLFTWTPSTADIGTITFPIFVSDGIANVFVSVTIVVSA
ncbi:MAG: putative Ig domain-containing protein [Fuerstiella sp.]